DPAALVRVPETSILHPQPKAADIDVYHARFIFPDDASDKARDFHRGETAMPFHLENAMPLPPRNARSVGTHRRGIDTDLQPTIRLDFLPASTQHQPSGNETVTTRGDESLFRAQRIFLREVLFTTKLTNLGPAPRDLFSIKAMQLCELGLLGRHPKVVINLPTILLHHCPADKDRR